MNVYLETDAPVPVGMLLDAKSKVAQMFREIGVNARMRNGIPARDPSDTCGAPIVVRIENAAGYRGGADALACAAPYKEYGACIHVFVDRVLLKLNHEPFFANALLTHVSA